MNCINILETAFDYIGEGLIITDCEGRIKTINENLKKMLPGLNDRKANGENLTVWFDKTAPEIGRVIQKSMSPEKIKHKRKLNLNTGRENGKYLRFSAVPIAKEGSVKHIIYVVKDITRKRRIEERLERKEKKYRTLFENTGAATCIIEKNTVVSLTNKEMEKLTGYSREELEGKMSWKTLVAKEDELKKMVYYHYQRRKNNSDIPGRYEFKLKDRQGNLKDILVTVDTIPDTDRSIASFMDITELKRTEQKLEQTIEKLNNMVDNTVEALSRIVEVVDPYTSGHQKSVARLAVAVAERLGMEEHRCPGLELAALIHDLGKVKVPSSILNKPAALTDIEFELIKTHSRVGYEVLREIKFPWPIASIIRQHHERLDGSGYPDGLIGKEICLEARILAVADVVEAMNSHRPYRPAPGLEAALEEIERNKGLLYDCQVVETCRKLLNDNPELLG